MWARSRLLIITSMKSWSLRAPATNSSKESSPVGQENQHIRSKETTSPRPLLQLTVSVYVDPVKHAVGEVLSGALVVFVAVDGSDGLRGGRGNRQSAAPAGGSRKSSP